MDFSDAAWKFGQKLTEILGREKNENVLVSPVSAFFALSAAMIGAKGATKKEFVAMLMGPERSESESEAFFDWVKLTAETIQRPLTNMITERDEMWRRQMFPHVEKQSRKGNSFTVANKICINKLDPRIQLLPPAERKVEKYFGAHLDAIHFGDKKAVDDAINKWASEKTNGKITKIVDELNPILDKMVILNAVYFKGIWDSPFYETETSVRPFFIMAKKKKINIPFLHKNSVFGFCDVSEIDAKVLEIYYKDTQYKMVFILPNRKHGVDSVEQKMQGMNLEKLLGMLEPTVVDLHIPKFKIESKLDLQKAMKEVGCKTMFSQDRANFTGFCGELPWPLFISGAVQKTFIEVNEKGTEAAAVTSITLKGGGGPTTPPNVFDANHPFLFYLIHHKGHSSTVLFNGRVCDPSKLL